jgi:hypothetical protein
MATVKRTRAGEVLSDEAIEKLATEAEHGYDLERAKRRPVGRPSLGRGRSPRVIFRVDPETYAVAQAAAEGEHRPVSALARDALRLYLRRRRRTRPGAQAE